LDQVTAPSTFDLMETLATPLPVLVMAELLGIPPHERSQFQRWSHLRARTIEPTITPTERRDALRAAEEVDAYSVDIIRQRSPGLVASSRSDADAA
jgi:pimeloyl-[acyl-carrier protein] synthase